MQKRHDQLSKRIAREIFDPFCTADLEKEVPSLDAQHMDLWVEPNLTPPTDLPGFLVLPGRLVGRPSHFELWSVIPDHEDMHETQRKQLNWHHHLRAAARKAGRPLPDLFPTWTITPGEPTAYFARARARRADGWPPGFYWTDEQSQQYFVVLNQLERTRETLLLRLWCPGPARKVALAEIRKIPQGDPDRGRLMEIADLLRRAVGRDKKVPEDERREFMTEARAEQLQVIQESERRGELRGELRGEQRGERRGLAQALMRIYEQRLGVLPDSVRGALLAIGDADRLDALLPLFLTGSADDIARALLS